MTIGTRVLVASFGLLATACQGKGQASKMASPAVPPSSASAAAALGTLRVGPSVPAAEIMIDSVLHGTGRRAIRLSVGSHRLVVRADGYKPVERLVTIRANEVTTETVTLERILTPGDSLQLATPTAGDTNSATAVGTLRIGPSVLMAEIIIDDVLRGTGRRAVRLAVGAHRLVVRADGYKPVERIVTIRANEVTTETVTLEKLPDV